MADGWADDGPIYSTLKIIKQPSNTGRLLYYKIFFGLRYRPTAIFLESPFHQRRSPCKSTTECCQQQSISLVQFVFPIPKAERNGACGSVAIFLNVDHHFFLGHTYAAGRCINDPEVGLVWHQPGDIVAGKIISFQYFGTYIGHAFYI